MTNYREILRLSSLGINNSRITASMGIARQTVITTLQRAAVQGLDWQVDEYSRARAATALAATVQKRMAGAMVARELELAMMINKNSL